MLERFIFGSFHIYHSRRDNDILQCSGHFAEKFIDSWFFELKQKIFLNPFVSNKSLLLNYSDCVKHCESQSMNLPSVDDTKRIKEEFQFIFDGLGTLSEWALIYWCL